MRINEALHDFRHTADNRVLQKKFSHPVMDWFRYG